MDQSVDSSVRKYGLSISTRLRAEASASRYRRLSSLLPPVGELRISTEGALASVAWDGPSIVGLTGPCTSLKFS